jgi:hypothetical protein
MFTHILHIVRKTHTDQSTWYSVRTSFYIFKIQFRFLVHTGLFKTTLKITEGIRSHGEELIPQLLPGVEDVVKGLFQPAQHNQALYELEDSLLILVHVRLQTGQQ